MQRAAKAAYDNIVPDIKGRKQATIHVLLGNGNNAGDGLLLASLLKAANYRVIAYCVAGKAFTGDAAKAADSATSQQLELIAYNGFCCGESDIIVDAMLGIGLSRPPQGLLLRAIENVNRCRQQRPNCLVYAIDIPTGLHADTGAVMTAAVIADKTITFIADKIGLHSADGRGIAGKVIIEPLDMQKHDVVSNISAFHFLPCPSTQSFDHSNRHKGDFGHALMIGGHTGMFGAIALSSVSALKVGTGKVSALSHPSAAVRYDFDGEWMFEVMRAAVLDDLSPFSAIGLGPGLGRDKWSQDTFEAVMHQRPALPLLVDADGLFFLKQYRGNFCASVITPHEGEAAALLKMSAAAVRADKPAAVRSLANNYRCIAVLKGTGTLVSDGNKVWINQTGNINLATAGSGDVLSGMITGYLAQGYDALTSALYAVFQHGRAADAYSKNQAFPGKTMRASDLWQFF